MTPDTIVFPKGSRDAEECFRVTVLNDLAALALTRLEDGHQSLKRLVQQEFGEQAVVGTNVLLAYPEPTFAIPHETFWRSASDTVIAKATQRLAAAADSVPATERERLRKYVYMSNVRVRTPR